MALQALNQPSPGLQHYDNMLALTGQSYRLSNQNIYVDVVFGMLDARTGHLPIGLINSRREYWEGTLYYDANRRQVDVYDGHRWAQFVDTYAKNSLSLGLLTGIGYFLKGLFFELPAVILAELRSYLVIMLFMGGFVGLLMWAFFGYFLLHIAYQLMPFAISISIIWGILYVVADYRSNSRRTKVARQLEHLIDSELAPVFS